MNKKVVKLDAKGLSSLVKSIVKEERNRVVNESRENVIRLSEADLRKIVKEELTEMLGTQPQGVEYRPGEGERGPLAGAMDDAKIDQLVSKISGLDLSDEEIDALVGKLKAEAKRRRGERL